jgi:hypothetical protein
MICALIKTHHLLFVFKKHEARAVKEKEDLNMLDFSNMLLGNGFYFSGRECLHIWYDLCW